MTARMTRALCTTAVLASLALAVPAFAQDAETTGADYASATPASDPFNSKGAAGLRGSQPPDDGLGNALMFDPASVVDKTPAKPLRKPRDLYDNGRGFDMKREDRPDGSTAYKLNQPVFTDWDAKVGADLNTEVPQQDSSRPIKPQLGSKPNTDSGAAWANVGVANFGSLEARVDPSQEQGRVGATLQRTVPAGRDLSVTLQNTLSVTDTFGAGPAPALPTGSVPAQPRVWGNEQTVKFNVLPTGTTLAAGVSSMTNDPVTHNKLSAEQKVYGPLRVTTSVTDVGQTSTSKSISAGFKLNW